MRSLDRPDGYAPSVGALLAMMGDCRSRTLDEVGKVDPGSVDAVTPWSGNTIGTLLYHVAAIELDWLYADILQREFPGTAGEWFPADVREEDGRLSPMTGDSLDRHLERLAWVRGLIMVELRDFDEADLQSTRPNGDGSVTVEWILHHLLQHEAEHRGQLGEIRTSLGS